MQAQHQTDAALAVHRAPAGAPRLCNPPPTVPKLKTHTCARFAALAPYWRPESVGGDCEGPSRALTKISHDVRTPQQPAEPSGAHQFSPVHRAAAAGPRREPNHRARRPPRPKPAAPERARKHPRIAHRPPSTTPTRVKTGAVPQTAQVKIKPPQAPARHLPQHTPHYVIAFRVSKAHTRPPRMPRACVRARACACVRVRASCQPRPISNLRAAKARTCASGCGR